MRQQTLASQASFEKFGCEGERELFLEQMEQGGAVVGVVGACGAILSEGGQRTPTSKSREHAADLLSATVVQPVRYAVMARSISLV